MIFELKKIITQNTDLNRIQANIDQVLRSIALTVNGDEGEDQIPVLANGWVTGSGVNAPVFFHKMESNNHVMIHGWVINGTGGSITGGTTIFTLPVGYRPSKDHGFAVRGGGGTFQSIIIQPSGVVYPEGNTSSGAGIALELQFEAE
jgi:hypothetical protein